MHSLCFLTLILFLAAGQAFASWKGISYPYPIHDAVATSDGLWLATEGGIRFLASDGSGRVWTAADGLGETQQVGIARTDDGYIYAFSQTGIISQIKDQNSPILVINKSFQERGISPIAGQIRTIGKYLWIPFNDRLSVFNTKTRMSVLTWTRLGNDPLSSNPIREILVKQDTVFVRLDSHVVRRTIVRDSIEKVADLADPGSWKVDSMTKVFDQSKAKDFVQADTSGIVRIEGKDWTDDVFCPNGVCLPSWIHEQSSSIHWIGNSYRIWRVQGKIREDLSTWKGLQLGGVASVAPLANGSVVAWQPSVLTLIGAGISGIQGQAFYSTAYGYNPVGDDSRQNSNWPMKSLQVNAHGELRFGTWGAGLFYFPQWSANPSTASYQLVTPFYGACFDAYDKGASFAYAIVTGIQTIAEDDGTIFSYWGPNGGRSGIGYLAPGSAEPLCLNQIGSEMQTGAVAYSTIEGSKNLEVFSAQISEGVYAGVDVFEVTNPSTGIGFNLVKTSNIRATSIGTIRDMAFDSLNQRLWIVGKNGVGYWNAEETGDSVQFVETIVGPIPLDLSSVEIDRHQKIWLGSFSRGAFLGKMRNNNPDTLEITNYQPRDGLLSIRVNDLAIDASKGQVWFAHDLGVSLWVDASVRDASLFQKEDGPPVMAYPNPFRPGKHTSVIFDYMSESARLRIMDSNGNLIREFSGESVVGGRLEWDGKNRKGQLVAPGVYHWIAALGSHSQHGRLLIIR